jgi:hypothetical protein
MDRKGRRAQAQVAEAELQVLGQEMRLRRLINTGAPTAEAPALLKRLRGAVTDLAWKCPATRCR